MPVAEMRIVLPAEPATVFDHLSRAELLTAWWPTSAETDPRPGGTYRLHWDGPDVTLRGSYEVVERPVRLRYTWSWDHEDVTSVVTFVLAAIGPRTELTVRHAATSDRERDDYLAGWTHFLGRLDDLLAAAD
jgi:uncharacterized protein YndB with AHSA1/START domain